MRKLLLSLLAVWMTLPLLCACALAEEDSWLWVLASAAAPLSEEDVPDNLQPISTNMQGVNVTTTKSMLLQESALEALYRLMRAADQAGVTLYVRQAYRSYAEEARRYGLMNATGQVAQKPGESSYQTGLSVTLVGEKWRTEELTEAFADSREAKWLRENAATYGFVLRYPEGKEELTGWTYEPWHYRYVGLSAAATMDEQGLCLEELTDDPATRSAWLVEEDAAVFRKAEEEADEDPPAFADNLVEDQEDEPEEAPEPEREGPPTGPSESATGEFGPDGDYEISLFH